MIKFIEVAIWIVYGIMAICVLGMAEAAYCMRQQGNGKTWNGKKWVSDASAESK
jgi:hypothetical protein